MIRTIQIGAHIYVQGTLRRLHWDGKHATVSCNGARYTGRLIERKWKWLKEVEPDTETGKYR